MPKNNISKGNKESIKVRLEEKLDKRTSKRKTGDLGEEITCQFLMKRGYEIKGRNYLKKFGELDIIATKQGIWHFVEVKSVSCERLPLVKNNVIHETGDNYRPEDNVHPYKLKRLARTIQAYILEKKLYETEWQCDIATVYLHMKSRRARVFLFEDIVF